MYQVKKPLYAWGSWWLSFCFHSISMYNITPLFMYARLIPVSLYLWRDCPDFATTSEEGYYETVLYSSLFSNEILLFNKTLLSFMTECFTIQISLRISVSLYPSSVKNNSSIFDCLYLTNFGASNFCSNLWL